MRKKYLSALLFGALLFASAGTFTSCKDYDDDINGLRTDITDLQSAISTLQSAVEKGRYVSGVAGTGNQITFTFTDGTTQTVTVETESGDPAQTVTIGEDGEVIINGEGTGYYTTTAPTEAEVEVGLVKQQEGTWWVLGEDGEYTNTNIPVSGVTVSGSEAEGYTFTIYAADGTSQVVELPTAASSITEMTLGDNVSTQGNSFSYTESGSTTNFTASATDFLISRQEFVFTRATSLANDEVTSASAWMGNKEIPSDHSWIYASPTEVDLRMDPVDVPANNIQFYLTNTKNENLQPVVLTARASQDSNNAPMGSQEINSRAAVTGNGLWTLSMANQVVSNSDNTNYWNEIEDAETNGSSANPYVYALNANHAFRSKYELTTKRINPEQLTQLQIPGGEGGTFTFNIAQSLDIRGDFYKSDYANGSFVGTGMTDQNITYRTGRTYTVEGVEASALYDMYLTADASDTEVYGLTFDQDAHTFTIGRNPDVSSIPAEFDLIIYTVANNGTVEKTTVTIVLNTQIDAEAEYGLHEHNVNVADNNNYFDIDLATMKTSLGDNLNQWLQNVDLNQTEFEWSADDDTYVQLSTISGITAHVVSEVLPKNNPNHAVLPDRNNANFIQVDVDNSAINGLDLDHTYYIKVTFKRTASEELNSITVPVEFHAPALSDLFTIKEGYQEEGSEVINAYFYQINGEVADGIDFGTTSTQVYLDRYFSEYVPLADISVASGNVGETGMTGTDLFVLNNTDTSRSGKFGDANGTYGHMTFNFNTAHPGIDANGNTQNGYGETVTINATKDYFNTVEGAAAGWDYTQAGDNEYSFQIRLMSPIAEGSVVPATGSAIAIDGNDLAAGASITSDMIEGRTYNNVRYSIVPDVDAATRTASVEIYKATDTAPYTTISEADYSDPQIQTIVPHTDENNYLQNAEVWSAYTLNRETVPGELKIYSSSISRDMTIQLPITVTDIWGVVTEQEVPVSIQFNE